MRKILFSILVGCGLYVTPANSSQVAVADTSIVQHLTRADGSGRIRIVQDARITAKLSRNVPAAKQVGATMTINGTPSSYITMSGYRIQVFSDNNQRKSKDEANRKASLIRGVDTEIGTYVTYTSPFWRLRVGDFRTFEEANAKLRDLKIAFPEFAKEMRIVRETVRIPQYESLD